MTDHVRITDVSPRDGLQNERGVVATADKVTLIEALARADVNEIEATSFVSPKWVPQLGDAGEVLSALKSLLPLPTGEGRGEGVERRARKFDERTEEKRDRARELRATSTFPERLLWGKLRGRRFLGVKFRRQSPIGPYIADFFCEAHGIVVELDGRSHLGKAAFAHDQARNEYMKSRGLDVIRFSNDQVLEELDSVLRHLKVRIEEKQKTAHNAPLTPALSRRERGKSGDAHPAPVLTVLVPNAKGFERAKQFHSPEFPLKIAVFTAASETFNQKNTNASIAESIDRFHEFIPEALDLGMAVRLYVSTVVACPYEGAIAPAQVRRVCDQLIDLVGREPFAHGDAELDLGDTIGAATPGDIHALLAPFEEDELRSIVIHLHDTFGRAADCVKASLQAGIRSFDGSVAGLGGCPFAGTKESPAPGNISTELLVQTVQAEGFSTDVDQHALQQAAAIARDIVGKARAAEV